MFTNPVDYFRFCSIDKKCINVDNIENMLNVDVRFCCWIDCLGRQVKIRSLAIDEVKIMIQCHLEELDPNDDKLAMDMNTI